MLWLQKQTRKRMTMKNKKTKYRALQTNLLGQKIGKEFVKKVKEEIAKNVQQNNPDGADNPRP